ncbi:MAG: serine/arginine repetitive matrix protein 2 [Oscillospiraceae bacterium]|nr:serine/arginine repetitive matrix protein 2 [Oscillospiraceae bacterium]
MEQAELYSPQISITLGTYTIDAGVEIEIHSSADSYFDWAKVRFTEQYQAALSLACKDPAVIRLGYNDVFYDVFTGYIWKTYSAGASANEIILKDSMLALEETEINNTFMETTPQEMLRYCLAQAGVTSMQLTAQTYPTRSILPVRRMNVIQAIQTMHNAWNIFHPFYFMAGTFYWGVDPTQEKVYTFEYGVNILSLQREGGRWELETVSAPFVKHSDRIIVDHPQVSGTYQVNEVMFATNESGFIRTYIRF